MRDKLELLAGAQAFTATAVSTDSYKLPAVGDDISAGQDPAAVRFTTTVAASAGGTQTYTLEVISATAAALNAGIVVLASRAFTTAQALADLTVGNPIDLVIPPGVIPTDATHIGARITCANTPTITVDIELAPLSTLDRPRYYEAAVNEVM